MSETAQQAQQDEWAVLELMGHRKYAGRISEVERFGAAMARLEVFAEGDEEPRFTQDYSPQAIYCLTPCTEALARRYSNRHRPEPISGYELERRALSSAFGYRDDEEPEGPEDAEWEEEFEGVY